MKTILIFILLSTTCFGQISNFQTPLGEQVGRGSPEYDHGLPQYGYRNKIVSPYTYPGNTFRAFSFRYNHIQRSYNGLHTKRRK